MKEYYQLLECNENSSLEEIKLSFRRLSKQWHPDINKSPGASDRFKKISQAYDWLKTNHRQMIRTVVEGTYKAYDVDSKFAKTGYMADGEFNTYRLLISKLLVHHTVVVSQEIINNSNVVCHCSFGSGDKFAFRIPKDTILPTVANIKTDFGKFRITILNG